MDREKTNSKKYNNSFREPIYVTQPSLPPLREFNEYLEKIWDNKILTNNGPFHQQLENELASYLGVPYISLFANGTLALVTALQALCITGEVITTPYSFVATTHSLWWNNIKPVFVDIEPEFFNLDPNKIEAAITPRTSAILPVHVYGNPCKVEHIKEIAEKHGLKVIYDAAHAFGVNYKGKSILNYGELSILSFHATKVFNTMEGGAIICHSKEMKHQIDNLKNFGFRGETNIEEPGINAKMSEFQSAFGLLQLKYIDNFLKKRKVIAEIYNHKLSEIRGIDILDVNPNAKNNYSYFPILIDKHKYGKSRDELYINLKEKGIYSRRYFYPLISNFKPYNGLSSSKINNLTIANQLANKVICLPIYPSLETDDIHRIIDIIKLFAS